MECRPHLRPPPPSHSFPPPWWPPFGRCDDRASLEQITAAPDCGSGGVAPTVRKSALQGGNPAHQLAGGVLGVHDVLLQLPATGLGEPRPPGLALEGVDERANALLDAVDLVLEPD